VLFSVALEASHPSGPIGWFDVAGLSPGPASEKKAGTYTNLDPKTLNSLGLVKKLGFVLAPARTRLARKQNAGLLVGSPSFADTFGRSHSQKWKIIYLQVLRASLLRVPLTRLLGTFIAICPAGGHIIDIQCLTLGGIFNAVQCNSFTNQLVHALYSEAVTPFAQFRMAVTEP